jgi:hypothetical protein
MGMFDSIYFNDLSVLDFEVEHLVNREWQTKDMYDRLYTFQIENCQIYYTNRQSEKIFIPITGTFHIYCAVDLGNNKWYDRQLVLNSGVVVAFREPFAENTDLPMIPAMEKDAEEDLKNWGNRFQKLDIEKDEDDLL